MSLEDFFKEVKKDTQTILDSSFEVEINDSYKVPSFNDSNITFANLEVGSKKCKLLETCVLYVDIRNSTNISVTKQPKTLARLYSAFIRNMIAAARYYGGHIRNIVGDRVMVIFDKTDSYTNAINTAVLINSLAKYIINKNVNNFDFKCGIGIDFGEMLIVKTGTIRRGGESEFYRSLVWLGRPANIASKLTDLANKTFINKTYGVEEGHYYPHIKEWSWYFKSYRSFMDNLETTFSPILKHKNEHFNTFIKSFDSSSYSYPPILMTEEVYDGYKNDNPNDVSIENNWWKKRKNEVNDYNGNVYGGDVIKTIVEDI